MLCAKFSWNWLSGSGEEDFLKGVNVFIHYFVIISSWKRADHFTWTNMNPALHPRMLCSKFGWDWLSGSGEKDFFNFVNAFSLFRNYLPLEKGGTLHLNKLESPLPKDALCQFWLKLAQWFWREKMKMWKVYRQTDAETDGQTDDGRKVIWKAHLSYQLGELKTKLLHQFQFSFLNGKYTG